MADTAIRYISMLQLIPRYPRSISTTALQVTLAEQGFDINVRSIQRDLEKLSAYFPLIADETVKPFAWSFDAQAAAQIFPMLDMPAAVTFELARAYLSPVLPPKILSYIEPHFKEAQTVLKRNGSALAHWPEKIRVIGRGLNGQRPVIDAEVLESVTQALLNDQKCTMVYQARRWPEPEMITVNPLGLVFREPNTYLIATIDGREQVRQLPLQRMHSVSILPEAIVAPEDFDLDSFIGQGEMHVLHSDRTVELTLRCDKPEMFHLLESSIGLDQQISEQSEKDFKLEVTLADSKDLRFWLMAQSPFITILSPDWLRQEVHEMMRQAIKRLAAS